MRALIIVLALLAGCGDSSEEENCPSVGERFEQTHGICPEFVGPVKP